ncbi:MAG: transglycosylase SLT domain-containing protein [Bacteroidetes bacterium]|nr:transglycosylase SLT domain-containing protein [Bacteroidota bacterium]MBS1628686.1 transglycosylase SLT domain-containing protein [Bacteroidota bacterium]
MPFTRLVVDIGSPSVGSHRYQTGAGWYDFASPKGRQDNVAILQRIVANYSASLNRFADALDIPRGVLAGFIATESGGKMVTRPGSQFKGLMQCAAGPFYDAFVKWNAEVKGAPIPDTVRQEVQAKCPQLLQHSMSRYSPSTIVVPLSRLMESDASFNIMSGAVVLRWNLERFAGNLNKAIIAYNAGPYNKAISQGTRAITAPADTASLVRLPQVNTESKGYLKKMLGVGSYLALVYKEKLVNI